ncbi:MAG: hypothetical protein GTO41_22185 [Burkholderiales bacterium]|nr:hypothetical protein [Burkholderiales bacterium]
MGYSRYNKDCDYYIFRYQEAEKEKSQKEEERLAIWHAKHRREKPVYTYTEVRQMLEHGDFSPVPGYDVEDREFLRSQLEKLVPDVDEEHKGAG